MIEVYVLEGCPYCNNTLSLLDNSGKKYKKIVVPYNKKDYYKKRHGMDTFPQVLVKKNNMYLTLGGNSDIMKAFDVVNIVKSSNMKNEAMYLFLDTYN